MEELQNKPLISICIPAYNCAPYIEETIDCIINQTYRNIEIIVIDDGSSDNTLSKLYTFNDSRLNVSSVASKSASKTRNLAYKKSIGEYIIFFDADDYVQPTFIEQQYKALVNQDKALVVSSCGRFYNSQYGDVKIFDDLLENFHSMREWIIHNWYNKKHNTPPGRLLIQRNLLEDAGYWNEELNLNDDFEFFTRLALNAKKIIPNKQAIYYYRSDSAGLSSLKGDEAYRSLFKSFDLSFKRVLDVYEDGVIKESIANLWQSYLYEVYPLLKNECLYAKKEIDRLGGANLVFPSGGISKLLASLFGWKLVKQLKYFLSK